MAETIQKIIKTTFQFKRGQSADWSSVNPLLAPGEPGFELDTGKLKIGNGVENWNTLPYLFNSERMANEMVLIPATETSEAFTQADLIQTIAAAEPGMVLTKQDGILTWTKPIQENDLADVIANSSSVREAIADKISEELADATVLRFKGEALTADDDMVVDGVIPALYDNNMQPIVGHDGDVYLYNGTEYVYDSTVTAQTADGEEQQGGWVALGESERFNSIDDLVTQDEFLTLQQIISNIKSDVSVLKGKTEKATNTSLGIVKGSTSRDKISINTDGTMSVNSIGIDKLVNVAGIELVLDGGTAAGAVTTPVKDLDDEVDEEF